jgi:hypothetical protein
MLEKEGIVASDMNEKQQALLFQLIGVYLNNFTEQVARKKLETIRSDGLNHLRFAWAGFAEPVKPHYYRIQSRNLLIEYDNTQNNANHIHTVVRHPKNDFGFDLLKNHYDEHKQGGDHSHR